jgi:hypothetical protein
MPTKLKPGDVIETDTNTLYLYLGEEVRTRAGIEVEVPHALPGVVLDLNKRGAGSLGGGWIAHQKRGVENYKVLFNLYDEVAK